jgi:DNA-binding response OmpR family regulator
MKHRVLLVEDDLELAAQVQSHLEALDCEVITWREGHHIAEDFPPDVSLVVLDLMLPKVSGLDVLTELRRASDTPVLVLSARQDTADKVEALRRGADDYMTKPFWPEELQERVRARLRRPALQRGDRLTVGALELDLVRREARLGDRSVTLTRVEFELLLALARRPGAAVPRRWLVNNVLDVDKEGGERTLDVHASRLRKKLGAGLIETVWGVGYRLANSPPSDG